MRQRWPEKLWIVRHGQSAGNVARDAATAAGLAVIDLPMRDVDVPLSPLGEQQAAALGHWFAAMSEREKPQVVLSSPYVRACQTAQAICDCGGVTTERHPILRRPRPGASHIVVDERLREREFGVFDRLTTSGIREKFPDLAEHRALLGKFYHRPPGGESWADVILRLRSALDTVSLHHADQRVLIVCHQVVVLCLRYILEEMDEARVLAIDKEGAVLNCGVCEYDFEPDDARLCVPKLLRYNFAAPLLEEHAPLTSEPDAMVASR
jgi:broad specificity phosphatase PhoE